ncbi:MAG: hypothetical protein KY455_02660 [Euryarchaeota archaeon]|nr:hypothetical protein [Euryarchaeota archaeon]
MPSQTLSRGSTFILLLVLLVAPFLAGCTKPVGEPDGETGPLRFLPGRSAYCGGAPPEGAACTTDNPAFAFEVEVLGSPSNVVRVLHESGVTTEGDAELVVETGRFRLLTDYELRENAPADRNYQVGLGAHVQVLAGLLPMSLVFAEDGRLKDGEKDIEGTLTMTAKSGEATLEAIARPVIEGPARTGRLVLVSGDGFWPPQRMSYEVQEDDEVRTEHYYRGPAPEALREGDARQDRNLIRPTPAVPWTSGRMEVPRVPTFPAEFTANRTFESFIEDARALSAGLDAWVEDHPQYRVAASAFFEVAFAFWSAELRDGCERAAFSVRYEDGNKTLDSFDTRTDCTDPLLDPADGPVAMSDPLRLVGLADVIGLQDLQPRLVSYTAPSEAGPVRVLPNGTRTSTSADWSLHYNTIAEFHQVHWIVEHVLSSDLPESVTGEQTIRALTPVQR